MACRGIVNSRAAASAMSGPAGRAYSGRGLEPPAGGDSLKPPAGGVVFFIDRGARNTRSLKGIPTPRTVAAGAPVHPFKRSSPREGQLSTLQVLYP